MYFLIYQIVLADIFWPSLIVNRVNRIKENSYFSLLVVLLVFSIVVSTLLKSSQFLCGTVPFRIFHTFVPIIQSAIFSRK